MKVVIKYPAKTISILSSKNGSINALENVLTDIGLVKGKNGILLSINGYGGCNSCSELYSLYNLKGVLLYELYQSPVKVYSNKGNLDIILKSYGIEKHHYLESKMDLSKNIYSNLLIH